MSKEMRRGTMTLIVKIKHTTAVLKTFVTLWRNYVIDSFKIKVDNTNRVGSLTDSYSQIIVS